MKKRSIFLSFCWMVLGAFWAGAFASNTDKIAEIADFKGTGFVALRLSDLSAGTAETDKDFVSKLHTFYQNSTLAEKVYLVTDYPKAEGKTRLNYEPSRPTDAETGNYVPFENMIFSRYNGTDGSSHLSKVLTELWIPSGFSSHAFVTLDGTTVYWVNPIICKGQMAGSWNNNSIEVLLSTDQNQNIVENQRDSLASIISFANSFTNTNNKKIEHLFSHSEIRGSGKEGTIGNIDAVRAFLGLDSVGKKYEQTSLT